MSPSPLAVLVVDDQPAVVSALRLLFELHDLEVLTAADREQALEALRGGRVGVVVQDMNFARGATSGEEGAALFRAIRRQDPEMPVLLMTAWASLETAVALTKEGAADYLAKPWDDRRLLSTVRGLLTAREAARRSAPAAASPAGPREGAVRPGLAAEREREDGQIGDLVAESDAMRRVVALARTVAPADAPVLVTGPSGAGKERVAEIIHRASPRRGFPFVRVNVGAIPLELAEAELFGAEPGAYTGLRTQRIGHFEAADRGTLFLDELDAMPLALQVKMLRVLQSGEVQRLGASRPRQTDVRIVAASNADLERAVAEGRFRQDLLYRLDVVRIHVPPLAERPDDVLPLARHFLTRFAGSAGDAPRQLAPEACAALLRHDWPGNVRELANRVQRAVLVGGPLLSADDLGLAPRRPPAPRPAPEAGGAAVEREELAARLRAAGGSVTAVARSLGISRQALYRRMERLGLEIERQPKP
jgi:DNA-binding NtrC family response regulator